MVAPLGRLNLGEFGAVTCVLTAALVAHVPVRLSRPPARIYALEYTGLENQ